VFAVTVVALMPIAVSAVYHCDELNLMRHVGMFAQGDFAVPGRPGLLWVALMPLFALPTPDAILLGGRIAAALATGLSAVLFVRLAGRENGRAAAVLALAILVASPSFLAHCFEIRTDTFVLPLQLGLLLLWLRPAPGRGTWWQAGLLLAAGLLFSQKTLYFAVALHLAIAVHALAAGGPSLLWRRVRAVVAMDLLVVACVLLWYGGLAVVNGAGEGAVAENLRAAASTAFSDHPLDKKARGLWKQVQDSPVLYVAAVAGLGVAVARQRRRPQALACVVVSLVLLSTIFVHRGFWHYYVASLEPFHALVAASLLGLLWRGRPVWLRALVLVPVVGTLAFGAARGNHYRQVHNGYQGAVAEAVEEIAGGEQLVVFDGIGLAPGHVQPGFFMTAGARKEYRRRFPDDGLIRLWRDPPAHVYVYDYMTRNRYLTKAERAFRHDHFVPYRDNVRLLGWRADADQPDHEVDILLDGPYTVWFADGFDGYATLDGLRLAHEHEMQLSAGAHHLEIHDHTPGGEVWLLWGEARRPDEDAVDWTMFPILSRMRYQHYRKAGDLKTPLDEPRYEDRKKKNKRKKR